MSYSTGASTRKNNPLQPIFLIDFANHRYVSWFFDINYEEYIPTGWEGVFDNPLNYLSDEAKTIWGGTDGALQVE
jgi:hypothetical protein